MDKKKIVIQFVVLSAVLLLTLKLALFTQPGDISASEPTLQDVFRDYYVIVRPIDGGQYVAVAIPTQYPQIYFNRALKDPIAFLADYERHPKDVLIVVADDSVSALSLLKNTKLN